MNKWSWTSERQTGQGLLLKCVVSITDRVSAYLWDYCVLDDGTTSRIRSLCAIFDLFHFDVNGGSIFGTCRRSWITARGEPVIRSSVSLVS